MISGPKNVLVSMRKTQQYRKKKLLLLSKLVAFDRLQYSMHDAEPRVSRDWFKAYRVFPSSDEVMTRYKRGHALSGFVTDDAPDEVKIAFSTGKLSEFGIWTLTFSMHDMYTQEMGMHFCKFDLVNYKDIEGKTRVKQTRATKKMVLEKMTNQVILLPYKKDGHTFREQFTLIYSDYDVLAPAQDSNNKCLPNRDRRLFSEAYFRGLK